MRFIKHSLALLLLVSAAFAQFTINGSHTVTGLGGLGTIGVTNCTTITQSGALPGATQGVAYNTTITASGGTLPYTWSLIGGSLPTGLTATQSGNSYVIAGTPTIVATSSFTVQVDDAGSCSPVQSNLSIAVAPSNTLTLQAASLPSGTAGNAYPTTVLAATGGTTPYASCAITSGALPGGLSIAVTNTAPKGCQISGTISGGASTYNFTARITDNAAVTASRAYSILVICSTCGPPSTYAARTDLCETGLETGCSGKGMKFDGTPATMSRVPVLWETNVTASCASPPCHRIGLNKQAVDPDFGTLMIRASDQTSPCNNGQYGINGPSGGDSPIIALTDNALAVPTAMFITQSSGTKPCLNYYTPSTHTVKYSQIQGAGGAAGSSTRFPSGASIAMTGTFPNHMYEFVNTTTQDIINDLTIDDDPSHTTPVTGFPNGTYDNITSRTIFKDFIHEGANCLPSSYASLTKSPWSGVFNVSVDDNVFTMGFGTTGQDHGFEIVRINRNKSGCRYFVTSGTGVGAKGDWGSHYTPGDPVLHADVPGTLYPLVTDDPDVCTALSAAVPCQIDDQFLLHGVNQTPDPTWVQVSAAGGNCTTGHRCSCGPGRNQGCQTYFLQGDTNLIEPCSGFACSGHVSEGYVYTYRQPGGGTNPLAALSRARPTIGTSPNPGTQITPVGLPSDYHGSYNNQGTTDASPMILSLADTLLTDTQGAGWTNRPPYPSAYYSEQIGCSTTPPGTCYRFGHAFNSTLAPAFSVVENIFTISPEGTWGYMMTDMMGNFGSFNGGNTCNMVGGAAYKKGTSYALNDEMTVAPPVAHGAKNNSISFKVTTAGTAGSTLPAAMNAVPWNGSATLGLNFYTAPLNSNINLNIFQTTTAGFTGTVEPNWDSNCSSTCTESAGSWQAAHLYPLNTTLTPGNNNASGYLFQVTTKGTSGIAGSEPNWNAVAVAGTVTDGTAVWINKGVAAAYTKVAQPILDNGGPLAFTYEGVNDCSGDAVILDLMTAH